MTSIGCQQRMIVINPALITQMGIEEAVLYQAIIDGGVQTDQVWCEVSNALIIKWLPMWDENTIKALLQNLVANGHIHLNSPPFGQSPSIIFSTNPLAKEQSGKSRNHQAYIDSKRNRAPKKDKYWKPSAEVLSYLQSNFSIDQAVALEQLPAFLIEHLDKPNSHHNWDQLFIRWVNKSVAASTSGIFSRASDNKTMMHNNWEPDMSAIDILLRMGVEKDFIKELTPSFILFWMEKGEAHSTWSTKFVNWIKYQWNDYIAKQTISNAQKPLDDNWTPSQNVLDILENLGIPLSFTEPLIPEFVLYWTNSKRTYASWDSKFLRQIKYQWESRLNSNPSQRDHIKNTSLQERLSDDSWAQ